MSVGPDPGGIARSPLEYPANDFIPPRAFLYRRDPIDLQDFKNYRLRDMWINVSNNDVWMLTNKTRTSGTWTQLSPGGAGGVSTLTGNSGGAIPPDGAGNIDVLGDGTTIDVTGAGNTLTISAIGTGLGQTITGDSGGALSPTAGNWNIIGGTGILTSGAGSTLTINSSGAAFNWSTDTTVGPFNISAGEGRIANAGAGQITYNLPAVCNVGDTFQIICLNANGYQIQAGGGQTVIFGNTATSGGGTITPQAAQEIGSSIEIMCVVANTQFYVLDSIANFTLT